MKTEDLLTLKQGLYALSKDIKIPFTNMVILKQTLGFINVYEDGRFLTTSDKDSHHRFADFPCVGFMLDNTGSLLALNKNFCGWMSRIVRRDEQEKYFNEFLTYLDKAEHLIKLEK